MIYLSEGAMGSLMWSQRVMYQYTNYQFRILLRFKARSLPALAVIYTDRHI